VVDTAGAVLLGLAGVGTILAGAGACTATTDGGWDNFFCVSPGERTLIIVSGLAITGVATALGFSAAHGYSTTSEYRQLKEVQLSCVSGVEAACRSLEVRTP
jgi:hypothetical protein